MTANDELRYFKTHDGLRLAYRVVGAGSPTVIAPAMGWIAEDLRPLGNQRAMVFFDIPGNGPSDPATDDQVGYERDVDDVEALRWTLGLDRIALFGWSYHGAVSVGYARRHRERVERIVLTAPLAPRAQPHWNSYLQSFSRTLDLDVLQRLERERKAGLPERDPEAWCALHNELILRVYVQDPACLERMKSVPCAAPNLDPELINRQMLRIIDGMGEYDWRAELQSLDCPVLIVHGDRDPVPVAGSYEWAEALPNARLEVFEDCGHLPWLEQPDRFFPLVQEFLADGSTA